MRDDFCIFIVSHGRPDRVHTYNTLIKAGYTGKVYIIIDDEDKDGDRYRQEFGDKVLQLCKAKWVEKTDDCDNFQSRKAVVYARNACWELAKQVGCRYFVQLDDDYTSFFIRHDSKYRFVNARIKTRMNELLDVLLKFYISTQAIAFAMSQGGDHIGGARDMGEGQKNFPRLTRKCINSWFCDAERPIQFFGMINEDTSAYVTHGHRGQLFLTTTQAMLVQVPTQKSPGGLTELYLDTGTYVKSFYTVMANPSCVQIGTMGDPRSANYRIHHKINWHKAVPKIIAEKHRKVQAS